MWGRKEDTIKWENFQGIDIRSETTRCFENPIIISNFFFYDIIYGIMDNSLSSVWSIESP